MASRKSTRNTPIRQLTEAERFNPPTEGRYITYDRITGDFVYFLDGEFKGYASSYSEAESRMDEIVFDQLTHTQYATADQAADMADLAEISELVDALVAQLGTGDLGYARQVLTGGLQSYAAKWDAWSEEMHRAVYAARCQGCGGGGQLVYGLCAKCRMATRINADAMIAMVA